jgi:tRNA(Ile)-lysidine synthase
MRGAEADHDAQFVDSLADDWGLSCSVEMQDVPELARKHKLAWEEAARRARYAFLTRVAHGVGARTIAVGHNADDQAETVMMHWLRGSGLAGLRGMLPAARLEDLRLDYEGEEWVPERAVSGLRLVRPLLDVPRSEIEAYCDAHRLTPRFDRSNLDTTYFRNWLRQEVFPLLAQHNPKVQTVLCRSAKVIASDHALLRAQLHDVWPQVVVEEHILDKGGEGERLREDLGRGSYLVFDLAAWRDLPLSLKRSTLREAIHRLRKSLRNINFVHVEDALMVASQGNTGDQATLPRGLMLTLDYARFVVGNAGTGVPLPDWPLLPADAAPLEVNLPGSTSVPSSEWAIAVHILEPGDLPVGWESNADPWRVYLDLGAAGRSLRLRGRKTGDRFCPLGLGGHSVKLGDFLTNQKVPQAARDRLPLLVAGGRIVWVCGQRIDERCRVDERTRSVLAVEFVRI